MLYPNKYKYKTKSVYSLANGAFGMKAPKNKLYVYKYNITIYNSNWNTAHGIMHNTKQFNLLKIIQLDEQQVAYKWITLRFPTVLHMETFFPVRLRPSPRSHSLHMSMYYEIDIHVYTKSGIKLCST